MPIDTYRPSNVPEYYLQNIPDAASVLNIIPFSFSSAIPILAPNVAVQQFVQTLADSDFLCVSLQSDNVSVLPTILLRDVATGWPFMSTAVPVVSVFGTASLPYFLPVPWLFKKQTSIEFNVVSTGAAIAFTLTLSGLRIFR